MSEFDALIDAMRRQGATVTRAGSGHWKISLNGTTVVAAYSPSDKRAVDNLRGDLRRAGLLPRQRFKLTDEEAEFMARLTEHGRGMRCSELPPKRLLDKGFVRVAKRSKGWMVWLTDKGLTW